jgi:hypothetical protein
MTHTQTVDDAVPVIAEIMGRILGTEPLDADRDFFLSGGDSVRAVELVTGLVERFRGDSGADGGEDAERLGSALLLAVFDDASPKALAGVIGAQR